MQKIMIIEDDSVLREELAVLLENEGYCRSRGDFGEDTPGKPRTHRQQTAAFRINTAFAAVCCRLNC